MEFTPEDFNEFKTEVLEFLENAEKSLLALERGREFSLVYDEVFRVLHSLKGGGINVFYE